MCRFFLPPGYTRTKPMAKPKLGALLPVIDAILSADGSAPVKQRHTAERIFEPLRDDHGYVRRRLDCGLMVLQSRACDIACSW